MTHVLANLTAQASTYAGMSGTVPLDGVALVNHRTFDADTHIPDGAVVRVAVFDKATGDSEIMVATYDEATVSLTRTATVLALGPNATTPTTPCDFQAGPKEVHLVRDAAQDSVTPGAGLTPRAGASGKIADGWLGKVPSQTAVGDYWWGCFVGLHATITGALPWTGVASFAGSSLTSAPSNNRWFGEVLCRTHATNAQSGYQLMTAGAEMRWRGGIFCRAILRLERSDARLIVGLLNGAATAGAMFLFIGLDVVARIGDGTPQETLTTYTLSLDTYYVFEVETAADNSGATFRVRSADTDAVLWEEALAGFMPAIGTATASPRAQLICPVNPGGVVSIGGIVSAHVGTKRGWLASQTDYEVAP